MSQKPYKLSAVLYGHSLDVRSVVTTPENGIISGSRDKTAKDWRSNGFNAGYVEAMTYRDQKNFVSAVLYMKPTPDHPQGLVVTGGNDNTILIYKPHEPFATYKITDHKDTVCFLSNALDDDKFLSASWDKTAKLWCLSNIKSPLVTFAGQSAALWSAIQLSNGNIATASADRTIALWLTNGQQFKSITGHTDCVRGLADLPECQQFVSVANDALVKIWNYNGELIDTLYGHNNYIYCISVNKAFGPTYFVTGDESNTINCWKDGLNVDSIKLPAQSVWSVACLANGDLVSGTSDGVVRVFSQEKSRQASGEVLKHFEEELNALKKQETQKIGGYKVSDLPGREALYDPGKNAGQIKMIREPEGVIAYSWVEDGPNSHWEKMGDVMGGNDKENEGKTLHEGKYYDFVFSVDVEDGKPPIKLPYNNGTDVYEAANQFLNTNNLPAVYLDQVVEFIRTNSQTADSQTANSSGYMDPFTGGSRYVPGATGSGLGATTGVNLDPLTGGNSYTTSNPNNPKTSSSASSSGNADPFTGSSSYTTCGGKTRYFPHVKYLRFDSGDPKVILTKLREFNEKVGNGDHKIDDSVLDNVVELCSKPCDNIEAIDGLFRMFEWPQDMLFPAIDVLRMAVRLEMNANQILFEKPKKLLNLFKMCLSPGTSANNTLLSFRALSNLFLNEVGEQFISSYHLELLENFPNISPSNKNIEIAMATFLLNLSILALKRQEEILLNLLESFLPDTMINCKDCEAHFRVLVALGNLLTNYKEPQLRTLKVTLKANSSFTASLEEFVNKLPSNDLERKRQGCGEQLKGLL